MRVIVVLVALVTVLSVLVTAAPARYYALMTGFGKIQIASGNAPADYVASALYEDKVTTSCDNVLT